MIARDEAIRAALKEMRRGGVDIDRAPQAALDLQIDAHTPPEDDHPALHARGGGDAEDLQAFVYAITEYVYDLTDRYAEFKERAKFKKSRISAAQMFASVVLPKAP
ncbi:MAG TPA: hypothetical protein VK512_23010 [Xanthobacteraceae bacterium]|nr:hypothetical protein [Xanthobacteraceae bacterium]